MAEAMAIGMEESMVAGLEEGIVSEPWETRDDAILSRELPGSLASKS